MSVFFLNSRKLFFRLICVFLIVASTNLFAFARKKSERENDELKGSVKSVSVKEAGLRKVGDSFVEGRAILNSIFSYDLQGNKVRADYYDNNTEVFLWKWIAVYNSQGNLNEFTSYLQGDAVYQKEIYKYNSANRKIKNFSYTDGKLDYVTRYKYSRKNLRVEELYYDTKGKFTFKRIFDYDLSGNIIKELVVGFILDGASNLTNKWIYEYDSNGNLTTRRFYQVDSESDRENDNTVYTGKTAYVYDEKENIVEEVNYESDNTIRYKKKFEYEFDAKGNWIKRTAYNFREGKENLESRSRTYRIINYY